ncbi:hypothetical protein [Streptomyces sp. SID13726]|uniref:hypothetical protein n=1 Tax=Streptomyces sp. SID13726 TaxID=2706058 RepID=UPI0013BB18BF|nr:hypothetical protein [Streptomyces sp. SID13726]NEB03553.1 hypothetical protein [Streptomyces sp. SID13726]
MIVVQRAVTHWTKQSRGGDEAARRNAVPEVFPVPAPGPAGVLVHEVDAHERDGFTVSHTIRTLDRLADLDTSRAEKPGEGPVDSGPDISEELHWGVAGVTGRTREAIAVCDAVTPVTRGVFLTEAEERLRVVVSPPAARSPAYGPRQLFTLEPGQLGRWRFNGRFTPSGCSCHSHQWWYEKWVVNVAYLSGTPAPNLFTRREPTYAVDNLVRLF